MFDNDGKEHVSVVNDMKGLGGRAPAEEQAAGVIDKQLDVATYRSGSGPVARSRVTSSAIIERTTPSVSVIIPCYNQAHFLSEAIESALFQTNRAIEVIVVDDGSPDNTAEVAERYSGILFVQQENRGLAEARNSGFRASRGEYVVFLDADDRLTPNAVESHLLCFAENPEAGFVVGDIDQINLDGSYRGSARWPLLESNHYEELLRVNHVANTIAVMFRRSIVEQAGGFRQDCSPAEDYELLLHTARLSPSAHHRAVVAQYRRYPHSLSRNGAVMLRAMKRVMALQRDEVKGNPKLLKAWREGERFWRDRFGVEAIKQMYANLAAGAPGSAARSFGALLWYVRWRLFLFPWKYGPRLFRIVSRRFRRAPERRDCHTSKVASG
jgi:glycosyltransferase involved in cell wall biosynthesis